jgi:hypothetical protein
VSSTEQSDPGVRAEKNQSLFREVNETVAQLHHTFRPKGPEPTWVCECADLHGATVDHPGALRRHP